MHMVTCPISPWSGWQLQLVLSCSGGRWGTRQAHSSLRVQKQSVALTSFGEQMVLSKIKHLKPVACYIKHPLGAQMVLSKIKHLKLVACYIKHPLGAQMVLSKIKHLEPWIRTSGILLLHPLSNFVSTLSLTSSLKTITLFSITTLQNTSARRVCVCVRVCMRVCMCVCMRACMHVCEKKRERRGVEKARVGERERRWLVSI